MARPTGFVDGTSFKTTFTAARTIPGVIVADNASLVDTNFPTTLGFDCGGYDTVLVAAEITAGASPTATIEALIRDDDAPDGSRWKRLFLGAPPGVTLGAAAGQTTSALGPNDVFELRVFGNPSVLFRVTAVTNAGSTNGLVILVKPGIVRAAQRKR